MSFSSEFSTYSCVDGRAVPVGGAAGACCAVVAGVCCAGGVAGAVVVAVACDGAVAAPRPAGGGTDISVVAGRFAQPADTSENRARDTPGHPREWTNKNTLPGG